MEMKESEEQSLISGKEESCSLTASDFELLDFDSFLLNKHNVQPPPTNIFDLKSMRQSLQ